MQIYSATVYRFQWIRRGSLAKLTGGFEVLAWRLEAQASRGSAAKLGQLRATVHGLDKMQDRTSFQLQAAMSLDRAFLQ
jgi:hypothetical protein